MCEASGEADPPVLHTVEMKERAGGETRGSYTGHVHAPGARAWCTCPTHAYIQLDFAKFLLLLLDVKSETVELKQV